MRCAWQDAGYVVGPPEHVSVATQLERLWQANPHKLRHTFGTRLIEAGVDLRVIRELLGHASVATTQVYTYVSIRHLRETIERLE